jgi:hypothetical protein
MTLLVSALLLSANQICLTIPLANASWVQVVDVRFQFELCVVCYHRVH